MPHLRVRFSNGESELVCEKILEIDGKPYIPQSDIDEQLEALTLVVGQMGERCEAVMDGVDAALNAKIEVLQGQVNAMMGQIMQQGHQHLPPQMPSWPSPPMYPTCDTAGVPLTPTESES
jgi:hypothetical protein